MTINMTPLGATALHMMNQSHHHPYDTTPLASGPSLAPIHIYRFDAVHQVYEPSLHMSTHSRQTF